jgi:hypothetical protein
MQYRSTDESVKTKFQVGEKSVFEHLVLIFLGSSFDKTKKRTPLPFNVRMTFNFLLNNKDRGNVRQDTTDILYLMY